MPSHKSRKNSIRTGVHAFKNPGCWNIFWTPWAARHFRKTLMAFKPDALWIIPHGWSIPPLASSLPKSGAPFHVTLQDFMDIQSYTIRYGVERSRRMAALQYQLYARAITRDATSHPMIADLRQQTGAEAAQMLHAGIEMEDLESLKITASQPVDKVRIAHAGSIQVDDVFILFVSALAKIRGQLPWPVSLELFGNHSHRGHAWFDATWMNERGNLPAAQLTEELRKCTWGFSPMALTDDDPRYNRLSFPTKFIIYLAAGLPVITLGHLESSVVKMAAAYPVGLCVTSGNPYNLSAQLLTALSDPHPGLKYRDGIRRCAAAEFDARRMRATLYECFQKCAAQTRTGRP